MKKQTDDLMKSLKSAPSIDDYLNENSGELMFDTLADWIEFHLITKNLKPSEVFKKSNIARGYGYEIVGGKKHPSRDKLIMLCFGLELTLEEVNQILKKTGYPELYPRDLRDSVIIFAFLHKYSIIDANCLLEDKGLKNLE